MLKAVLHRVLETRVYLVDVPDDLEDEDIENRFQDRLAFVKDPHDLINGSSDITVRDPTYIESESYKAIKL